jgi:hypothetical protein
MKFLGANSEGAIKPARGVRLRRLMLCGDRFEQALLHSIARQFAIAQARKCKAVKVSRFSSKMAAVSAMANPGGRRFSAQRPARCKV